MWLKSHFIKKKTQPVFLKSIKASKDKLEFLYY